MEEFRSDLIEAINLFQSNLTESEEPVNEYVKALSITGELLGLAEVKQSPLSTGTTTLEITVEYTPTGSSNPSIALTFDPHDFRLKRGVVDAVVHEAYKAVIAA